MPSPTSSLSFSVPTTNIWDIGQLQEVDVNSDEFKELLVRLYQNVNNIAIAVNAKDTGFYDVNEYLNSQVYFPNPATNSGSLSSNDWRSVSRKVINFGALPNNGTKSVAHGITFNASFSLTRLYGAATDQNGLTYRPLPYSSPTTPSIALNADVTNINIITGENNSNYTICYVVIEFLQS